MSAGTNFFTAISSHTNVALTNANGLAMLVSCDTAPETQANVYAVGCLCLRTDNSTLYQMSGTSASPSWTVNSPGAGATGTTGVTGATGPTGPSGP